MCLGVPGMIVARDVEETEMPSGTVEFAGVRRRVSLACTPEARIGDYVIVHAGVAISIVDTDEAHKILTIINELSQSESHEFTGEGDALRG